MRRSNGPELVECFRRCLIMTLLICDLQLFFFQKLCVFQPLQAYHFFVDHHHVDHFSDDVRIYQSLITTPLFILIFWCHVAHIK